MAARKGVFLPPSTPLPISSCDRRAAGPPGKGLLRDVRVGPSRRIASMRVFVTGLGIVSPLSSGARETMAELVAGARAFRPVTLFDTTDQRTSVAAEVTGLVVSDVAPAGDRQAWSRTDAMATVAAREALAEARLDPARLDVDLAVGGTTGGMFETEQLLAEMHRDP